MQAHTANRKISSFLKRSEAKNQKNVEESKFSYVHDVQLEKT